MRWRLGILWVASGVTAGAVAVVLVGLALPAEHEAHGTRRLAAPPERVWAAITGVEQFAAWRPELQRAERTREGWVEIDDWGDRLPLRVTASEPPRRLVTEIADPSLPYGGTWVYDLRPAGAGTELRITERGVVRNPIFRVVSRFILGHTASIERYLDALTRRLQ